MTVEREERLEKLLESLIKMLGKSNEKVDRLQMRVQQLESILRETVLYKEKEMLFFTDPANRFTPKQPMKTIKN